MIKPLVHIHNLTFSWEREPVLEDIDLKIFENDFIGITGPNGGGKTTLLKAVLGLIRPQKGKIYYREDLPRKKRPIGYLPQVKQLDRKFPITVLDVVRSGSLMRNIPFSGSMEEKKKAFELLDEMGISNLRKKAIGELSGGEMQRVFLCRALISDPLLLILDEPGTYVDADFENELFEKLKQLNKRMAVLVVSHDIGLLSQYAGTIVSIHRRLIHLPST
jgi:zinc transport system ATP-binding protein